MNTLSIDDLIKSRNENLRDRLAKRRLMSSSAPMGGWYKVEGYTIYAVCQEQAEATLLSAKIETWL